MALQLNEFGKKVFLQIAKEAKNLVVSPLSVFTALGMVSFGAKGSTKEELLKALHFGNPADVEPHISKLFSSFQSVRESHTLSLANNSFVNQHCVLRQQFLADIKRIYNSEVTTRDYFFEKAQKSANDINKWVEEQTQNKIKDLIDPKILNENTLLILVSALYFKATWEYSFDVKATVESPFRVTPKQTTQVQMMYKKGQKINYGENEIAKWVRLPYKPKGEEFSAIFVLPQKSGNLEGVVPFLFSSDANLSLPTHEKEVATLAIPKFKIEFGAELKPLLQKIGIVNAFSEENADFTGISENEQLIISNVIHKAMVEVDEQGTVASAATAVVMKQKGGMIKQHILNFIADEPFFFLLEHTPTRSIVFIAKVYDPSSPPS